MLTMGGHPVYIILLTMIKSSSDPAVNALLLIVSSLALRSLHPGDHNYPGETTRLHCHSSVPAI